MNRHAVENFNRADTLLFGRVTYEMKEAAFRPVWTGEMPDWMEPFRRTNDSAKKYVVSSTLDQVDWSAEFVRGDLGKAVQQLKQEPGRGLLVGGEMLPLALAELPWGLSVFGGKRNRSRHPHLTYWIVGTQGSLA